MEVAFRTRRLERCYNDPGLAQRTWGSAVARRYVHRIRTIVRTRAFAELYTIPSLRFHPLHGDREGQYSLALVGRWRLIVRPDADRVIIEEVTNHYGD